MQATATETELHAPSSPSPSSSDSLIFTTSPVSSFARLSAAIKAAKVDNNGRVRDGAVNLEERECEYEYECELQTRTGRVVVWVEAATKAEVMTGQQTTFNR